jgi:hypothetical protein
MMFLACCYNDPDMLIDPDTVYPTRPDCQDAPKSRFKPQAIPPNSFVQSFCFLRYDSHLEHRRFAPIFF